MKAAASLNTPFSPIEVDKVLKSLQNTCPQYLKSIDWDSVQKIITDYSHISHKDLCALKLASSNLKCHVKGPDEEPCNTIFERVLKDGCWDEAKREVNSQCKPWVVLVTGVNGIRKTTSTKQDWFSEALLLSLGVDKFEINDLPSGKNSFFRQLDYIIATIANEDFKELYKCTNIVDYMAYKDAIFARYRTLAEIIGVLITETAQQKRLNVMVETSGRDIAMFQYIDSLYPDANYRKMVVHFTINDITLAEKSVDTRMLHEMKQGAQAISSGAVTRDIISINSGGPYGSHMLAGVQKDSNNVWDEVRESPAYAHWIKARLNVHASDSDEWHVTAVDKSGLTCSSPFYFTSMISY
eukprot:CAMPEP_0170070720 /NCGR_PEP_ID=MMETSP0019_2-20121128/8904_1 /TAXON_ID=98059 /ORGANISM="Dinobryon sp., Strain UTEXLB2267" /LENGTH=353 /DNA_ID=CAMNT_0010279065 /DNA_START=76 /DNA_END=1137 /DNA_ORIENTATION=-